MRRFFGILLITSFLYSQRAAFSTIGSGVEAMGMGGVFVSCGYGPEVSFWNPAKLTIIDNWALSGCYSKLGDGNLPLEMGYFSIVESNAGVGSGGLTWEYRKIGLYGGKFSLVENTVGYSWGTNILKNLNFGIRPKIYLVSSNLEGNIGDATGYGLDLGVCHRITEILFFGASLWDIISRVSWKNSVQEPLPYIYQAGLGLIGKDERYLLGLEIRGEKDNFFKEIRIGGGFSTFGKILTLKGGTILHVDDNLESIITSGVSITLPLRKPSYRFSYSVVLQENNPMGDIHSLGLTINW